MIEDDLFADDDPGLNAAALTQQSLVDTQQRMGAMLDAMPMGLLIHTDQGILFANQEACRLLRAAKQQLIGRHLLDYVDSEEQERVVQQLRRSFDGAATTVDEESVLRRADGSARLVRMISGRLPWPGNPVVQILLQDITDQKRAEQSLRQLTITDELTGAYNRRHAFYEASLYVDADAGPTKRFSVVLLDVDHFKRINDRHGHAVGDAALKELAQLAHQFVPTIRGASSAMFARIGGEEFVLLLPGLGQEEAAAVAERLRLAIEALRVPVRDGALSLTASMGVASRLPGDTFDAMLSRADQALYRAKAAGRNRITLAA